MNKCIGVSGCASVTQIQTMGFTLLNISSHLQEELTLIEMTLRKRFYLEGCFMSNGIEKITL